MGGKRKWGGGGGGKKTRGGGKGKGKGKKGGADSGPGPKRMKTSGGPLPEQAVLISSASPAQCGKATREAIQMLYNALDALRPSAAAVTASKETAEESAPAAGATASDLLEAELRELRGEDGDQPAEKGDGKGAGRPRIALHGEVSRGIAVIACPRGPAPVASEGTPGFPLPSQLVTHIFESRSEGGSESDRAVRFVIRMLPLDVVCPPHLKNFQQVAEKAIPKFFAKAKPGATWFLAFHSRAMNTIKREDVLKTLKAILKPLDFDMEVSDAEYTVVMEVNPECCGFSVVKGYQDLMHDGHLQKACKAKALFDDDEDDSSDEEDEDVSEEASTPAPAVGQPEKSAAAAQAETETPADA